MAEKLQTGGLVLQWETMQEDPLLYVFLPFALRAAVGLAMPKV